MEKKPEQEKVQQQTAHETETSGHEENKKDKEVNLEGLPMEDSPYLNYKDLEDYKLQGYGAHGHQEPTLGRSAGGTDAPTPSGATAVPSKPDAPAKADVIKRHGVP
ncbi:hypothetical protein LWI29_017006 [Acer saccharum]|uniref:Late embryogenesis abundant protein, LEA-18 n=1 Tax=Acer saccharum TaxID=4024 RepID=A0AA39TAT1_ACESA|nr:hypothetical protein LWI29_017006 [Acer saccharum]KAK1588821.1 hypothetical protein Q3G72_027433 [Acer saccharum]